MVYLYALPCPLAIATNARSQIAVRLSSIFLQIEKQPILVEGQSRMEREMIQFKITLSITG